MNIESRAKSFMYVVLSGCLIAITIASCSFLTTLGNTAESFADMKRKEVMSQEFVADVIIDTSSWFLINILDEMDLTKEGEKEKVVNAVLKNMNKHKEHIGILAEILDRAAEEKEIFKDMLEAETDLSEAQDSIIETKDVIIDQLKDQMTDKAGDGDNTGS